MATAAIDSDVEAIENLEENEPVMGKKVSPEIDENDPPQAGTSDSPPTTQPIPIKSNSKPTIQESNIQEVDELKEGKLKEKEPLCTTPLYDPPCVKYLQFFSEDDLGVPPGCCWSICPLNHANWLFNHSWPALYISKFGLKYFDRKRKYYFGLASLVTMITFFITLYGCLALSTQRDLVQRTYWYAGTGTNSTDGSDFTLYIGLSSVEQVNCEFVTTYESYGKHCTRRSVAWWDPSCKEGLTAEACDTCSSAATGMWMTAFLNCATLVLAWLGAQTRMRVVADVPVQKIVGMWCDTTGVLSLAAALIHFHSVCLDPLDSAYNKDPAITTRFWSGPGFLCYLVCCLAQIIRAFAHILTPVPGQGKNSALALFLPCWFKDIEDQDYKYAAAPRVVPGASETPNNQEIELV